MMPQDIWLALLSASFGLWALVVGWATSSIVKRIDSAAQDLRELDQHMRQFVVNTERRLTRLETINHSAVEAYEARS